MKSSGKTRTMLIFSGVFYTINAAISVVFAFLLQQAVDAAGREDMRRLFISLALTGGIVLASLLAGLLAARLRTGYVRDMLLAVKRHRMKFLLFRRRKKPNEDESRDMSFFTADADILEQSYFTARARLPMHIATFVFAVGALLWINWIVTLAAAAVSMLPIAVSGFFSGGLSRKTKAYSEAAETYVNTVKECIDGKREIVAYDKQDIFLERHQQQNRHVEDTRLRRRFYEILADYVPGTMSDVAQIVIIGVSCYFVITGDMTFGFMIAIMELMHYVIEPVEGLVEDVNNMRSAKAIIEKASETNPPEPAKAPVDGFTRAIELQNLGLCYAEGEYVVQDLNLNFRKGGKYAIVAPSGYGKTSIARALALEFAEFDGAILLDGQDIRGLNTGDYNKILRYVRQDPYLFSDTAINNIAFFDTLPDRAEVDRVLALTRVNEFLPDAEALARPISNTSGLSGGQKQRLVLARALLHKPKVLVLDEITSGVDLETACLILEDIFADKELTCIAITHETDARFQSLFDTVINLKAITNDPALA